MSWAFLWFMALIGYDLYLNERRIRRLVRATRWERDRRAVLDREGLDAFLAYPPEE
jgi:hypothetical protein